MAVNIGPKIGIDGEREYRDAINNIIQQAKTLDSEMKLVASSFDKDTTAKEKNAKTAEVLTKQIENQKERVQKLAEMYEKSAKELGENDTTTLKWKEALNGAQTQLNVMEKQLDATKDGIKEEGEEAEKSSEKHEKLVKGLKAAGAALAAMATACVAVGKAFVDGIKDVASYGDNIDKMSQKMNMSAEAYQEWDFIAQHAGTSIESLKSSMKTLATQAQTNTEYFEKLGIAGAESMPEEQLFEEVIKGLQNVESDTERTYLASKLLGKGATELGAVMNMTGDDIEAMKKQAHELGIVMSDETVAASAAYADSFQNLSQTVNGLKNNLLGKFLPAVVEIMDGMTAIFSGNSSGIEQVNKGVNNFVAKLAEMTPEVLKTGTEIFNNFITAIIQNLPAVTTAAADVVLTLVDGLIQNLPMLIQGAFQLVLSLAHGIAENIDELIPATVSAVLQIAETLLDNIDMLIDAGIELTIGIARGLIDALPTLLEKVPEMIAKLVSAIIDNVPELLQSGIKLILGLANGIIQAIPKLTAKIPEVIRSIKDKFTSTDWTSIGKNIMEGIRNGITSMINNLVGTVKNVVSDLLDAAKEFLGIASPSKVFANKIGKYIPQGISLGIDKSVPAMLKDAKTQFGKLETTLPNMNGNVSTQNYGGFTINVNAAAGQDANEIADMVMFKIQNAVQRKEAVFV